MLGIMARSFMTATRNEPRMNAGQTERDTPRFYWWRRR